MPLRRRGTASSDTILESAPVQVSGRRVIYRLRYSDEHSRHIVLDAIVRDDTRSVIVQNAPTAFEHDVWTPMTAVESELSSPDYVTGDRDSPWLPKGCPRSISRISYCN